MHMMIPAIGYLSATRAAAANTHSVINERACMIPRTFDPIDGDAEPINSQIKAMYVAFTRKNVTA